MKKLYKYLLYIMPVCLFFSYHPVIRLGSDETMNFELSVALIWLCVFDVVGVILMVRLKLAQEILRGTLRGGGWRKWLWALFPVWCALSVIWSLNVTRGILTAGVLMAVYLAILIMVCVTPKVILDFQEFRVKWLKWFLGSALVMCGWCVVQCILDLVGAPREVTLMCEGCDYASFGFPHPNGFAIEPQFMGNLLLAPCVVSMWMAVAGPVGSGSLCPKFLPFCFFIYAMTLFLTFSRGAIYAFVVGAVFMSAFEIARHGRGVLKRVGAIWGVMVLAFLGALNVQGLMAQVSPTNDTYGSGVTKVLNHLSLGVIDWRGEGAVQDMEELPDINDGENINEGENNNLSEINNGVQINNLDEINNGAKINNSGEINNEAKFDGYVEESTSRRVELTDFALKVWRQDLATAVFGVGLGGAGQAMYAAGFNDSPKEIVQNEYASLLLETGAVGLVLFILTIVLAVRAFVRSPVNGMLLTLIITYGVTLCFFSGLPNALHIYLLPVMLWVVSENWCDQVKIINRTRNG